MLGIILKNIPQPADNVSWEQILDFKSDPNTQVKYYALLNWVNEISRTPLYLIEIEENFQYLLHEYIHQYHFHKLKQKKGKIELLVNGSIGVIENLIKLNWSEISKTFFNIWKEDLIFTLYFAVGIFD